MAVPKGKMSKSRTRSRRAKWKATPSALVECSQCKSDRLPHIACPTCGNYGERTYEVAVKSVFQN
jgi:large subunit ribosomal protein L32